MTEGLKLWDSVKKTDPKFTKEFRRPGGFKGTAVSATYLIQKATELWGPFGGLWGVEIKNEEMLKGGPLIIDGTVVGNELIHKVQIELRHPNGVVPAFGVTTFVGKDKNGIFTDEEAPKKSLTDALTKSLSWLGFAADIHLGMYDDNKYVESLRAESESIKAPDELIAKAKEAAGKDKEAYQKFWKDIGAENRKLLAAEHKALKVANGW